MSNNDNHNEFNFDEMEEMYKRAVLKRGGELQEPKRRRKRRKRTFNARPLILFFFICVIIGIIVNIFGHKTKVTKTNDALVDKVIYKEFIEDASGRSKRTKDINEGKYFEVLKKNSREEMLSSTYTAIVKSDSRSVVKKDEKTIEATSISKINDLKKAMAKSEKINTGSYYVIQVGFFKTAADAKKSEEKYKKAGYDVSTSKEGAIYKISMGRFTTREDATKYGKELESKSVIKNFFVKLKRE